MINRRTRRVRSSGRPDQDLNIAARDRDLRLKEARRILAVSNPSNRRSKGYRDPSRTGLEFVGTQSFWIRRAIKP